MSTPARCVNLPSDSPEGTCRRHIYNVMGARAGRCCDHGDRSVKRLFLVAVAAALLAPVFAGARDQRPGFGAWLQTQGGQEMKKGPGQPLRGDRNKRFEHDKGQKSRLTEEERRELNRDLDRANREIYRR